MVNVQARELGRDCTTVRHGVILLSSAAAWALENFSNITFCEAWSTQDFAMYYRQSTSRETGICACLAVFVRLVLISRLVGG
jgi:hypothetical protein